MLMLYYCNLNVIGTVYLTRTGLPLCLPGDHLGMVPITRRATLSKDGSTPRNTSASTTDPSRLTTNGADYTTLDTIFLCDYRILD